MKKIILALLGLRLPWAAPEAVQAVMETFAYPCRPFRSSLLLVGLKALAAISAAAVPLLTNQAAIPFGQIGAAVRQQYIGNGLTIAQSAVGATLRCTRQEMEGHVTTNGLWLTSTAAPSNSAPIRVMAQSVGRERGKAMLLNCIGEVEISSHGARFHRASLDEEYTVSMAGVQQDFIVSNRPDGNEALRVELKVDGAQAEAAPDGVRFVLNGSNRKLAYNRLKVMDAQGRPLMARMEVVSPDHLAVVVDDTAADYPVRIDPTFSDADWISFGDCPGVAGIENTAGIINATALDKRGNLYVGGSFYMAGVVYAANIAKWDGTNWSALGSGINNNGVFSLAFDSSGNLFVGGAFTAAGGVNATNIAKWDGTNWSALGSGMSGGENEGDEYNTLGSVYALVFDRSGNLYAGGSFMNAGGVAANNVAKWDGTNWSALGSGVTANSSSESGLGIFSLTFDSLGNLYAGGAFTAAGGVDATNIAKWNGSAWSALGSGLEGGYEGVVDSLAVDSAGNLYAGGVFSFAGGVGVNDVAKWNGMSWSAIGSGINNGSVRSLAFDSSGNLYAGGGFTNAGGVSANYVAKWNGNAWSPLGSGTYGLVLSLTCDSSGNLYAGGGFTIAGGISVASITKWNGSAWSTLGSGPNNVVSSLACDSSGNLYAGGSFSTVGSMSVNSIAKWNGNAWSALGSGLDGGVDCLAFDNSGNLYAGGFFTSAGGVPAVCIARWNGTNWSALGTGVTASSSDGGTGILSLAFDNSGNLYAGGFFSSVGGVNATNIAKWNGSTWSALGSGMAAGVDCLAFDGSGNLYAGREFTSAGGANTGNIAKWDGTNWSALGSGINNSSVQSLACDSSGNLYVGGAFTDAGGVIVNNISKWDGTNWSALGSGLSGGEYDEAGYYEEAYVYSLACDGSGNLYAGGTFTNAGGVAANNIAKWGGTNWSALGSGVSGGGCSVKTLALDGFGSLYAGGDFSTAGTTTSADIAEALLTGTNTRPTGSLQVTINPPKSVFDGAEWQVDGGAFESSGALVTGLSVGQHTVTFLTVDGWFTPANVTVTIISNQTTITNGTYAQVPLGALQVTITPTNAISAGAQWQVDGGSSQNSGATVMNLSVGAHLVSFEPVSGWLSPPDQSVTITNGTTTTASGIYTPTNTPLDGLTLLTNGYGTIQHGAWPKNLAIGKKYTVTATPKAKNVFFDWVASGSQSFIFNNASLPFTMTSGLVLEANFQSNIFLAAQGTYTGLFAPSGFVRQQANSGAFSFTVTGSGTVSGSLDLGGQAVPLSGKFNPDGAAEIVSKPVRKIPSLTTTLQLDFADQSVSGFVSNSTFTAALNGYRNVFSSSDKATDYVGQYTLVIPGATNHTGPFGTSYGTVKVSSSGTITLAGSLADGTSISQSSVVSQAGYWPFYVSLYGGKGSLWGTNLFANHSITNASALSWINGGNSSKTAVYLSGFTNQQATLMGGIYAPGQTLSPKSSVTLEDGDFTLAIPSLSDNTNKLKLTISKSTGVISGSFANPSNPKQTIKVNGVALQGQTNAQGYFLGTNQSGTFTLDLP